MVSWVQLRAKPARRPRKAVGATVLERPTQRALVEWLRLVLPAGSLVFAIVNEAPPKSPDPNARARFFDRRKQAGVVTGMPDIGACLPGGISIWFEVKRPKGGEVSAAQQEMHSYLRAIGHTVIVANGIEAARYELRAAGIPLRESAAEPASPARVRLAKPRAAFPADRLPV